MGLSIYNIKKWAKMLTGKSIMHVNQDMGKFFVAGEIKGYFNNLTEKVLKDPATLEKMQIPISTDEKVGEVYFPIAIFQYGLGAYDLYLGNGKKEFVSQFFRCVEWAVENQENDGSWNNFGFIQPEAPYSSMCQGEGASLLIRAYKETGDRKYLEIAKKAIDFMLISIENGGTTKYVNNEIIFYEYTNKPCVLNGWIFSIFGLYDLCVVYKSDYYTKMLKISLLSLKNHLKNFDCGYWSYYDEGGLITSPFYHDLHIAQLQALSMIDSEEDVYEQMRNRFIYYRDKRRYKSKAFMIKVVQKVLEK